MMRATKRKSTVLALSLVAALAAGACERAPDLETRTFALEHMTGHEAEQLVGPYVYGDRPEAPGAISTTQAAITVRETSDNLEKIERVLAEYDQPRSDVRLHFQLIEADGYTGSDPEIAEVEEELRKLFNFQGYRLAGEAFVTATDGGRIGQAMAGSDGSRYELSGSVYWGGANTIRLDEVLLHGPDGAVVQTTVNVRPGQTVVLGSTPRQGASSTLLLTVRAEEMEG